MKPSYTFYARPERKNDRNEMPIYLRIIYNRKTRYVSTGIRVEEKHWNDSREEVRKSHPSEKVYNEELQKLRLKAESIGFELERAGRLSAVSITEELKGKAPVDFVAFTEAYIERLIENGSIRLAKQTNVILNKVKDFTESESVEFNEITMAFLDDLIQYLKTEYKNHQNTIRKDYQRLRKVFKIA